MKALVNVSIDNLDMNEIKEEMRKEHNDYYGRHPRTLEIDGLGKINTGFFEKEHCFGWISSAGNIVHITDNQIYLHGRRHGIKSIIERFFPEGWEKEVGSYSYLFTERRDLKPWETAS